MSRVVLAEAWFRGSHAAWARSVVAHSRHDVELVTLPGVHWKWRMQGGAISFARAVDRLARHQAIDVVVATSAVDLAALAGLARRSLRDAATLLYLHENQVTFPLPDGEVRDLTYAMATWRSMLAADRIVCNSHHHARELLDALPLLLSQLPDHREVALVSEVAARTHVVGVGIDVERFVSLTRPHDDVEDRPARVLWNHRWEHDKDPGRFVAALSRLASRTNRFEVVVIGSHLDVDAARRDLAPVADHVVHVGAVDHDAYPRLLASCDVVVSTARHEFYGVAVAEAIAAGCVPVLPAAHAYPELVPGHLHAAVLHRDDADLDRLLLAAILDPRHRTRIRAATRPSARAWAASDAVALLDGHIDAVAARSR